MSELVVVAFKDSWFRAEAVLHELRELDEAWIPDLDGAIAVYRDRQGKLIVDQSFESTKGSGAIGGGLVGALTGFALAVLTLPLTAGAGAGVAVGALVAGAVGGTIVGAYRGAVDASWWKDDLGIPEDFLTQVRSTVLQDDSAIIFLLHEPRGDLEERFRPYGGTVLRATLTGEQTRKLHEKVSDL